MLSIKPKEVKNPRHGGGSSGDGLDGDRQGGDGKPYGKAEKLKGYGAKGGKMHGSAIPEFWRTPSDFHDWLVIGSLVAGWLSVLVVTAARYDDDTFEHDQLQSAQKMI